MIASRRTAVSWLALLPVWAAIPAAHAASGRFAPLQRPYRLARRVERQLGTSGGQLVVERSWSIRFVPQGRAFVAEGALLGINVEAPPALAALAQIERERDEPQLFPMLLDGAGQMLDAPEGRSDTALTQAIDTVRKTVTARSSGQDDRAQAEQFFAALQTAGQTVLAQWPRSLFAPAAMADTAERSIDLPDGSTGTVTVRTSAASDPQTGLMQRFERQVDTAYGSQFRRGRELFTLAPEV
jgi:hypothetical protein